MTENLKLECLLKSKPQYGYTSKAFDNGAVRMLRTTDITSADSHGVDWAGVPFCDLQPKDAAKFQLRQGDVLVSRAGTVGVSHLVRAAPEDPSVFASYLIRLVPDPAVILPAYLYWFMQCPAYWAQITTMSAGVAQPNINATKLRGLCIPVPDLAQQHAIVGAVERILSRLDKAAAQLDAIPGRAAAAREALLDDAASTAASHAPLAKLADLTAGPAFKSQGFDASGTGVRLLRGANVGHREVDWSPETVAHWPMNQAGNLADLALRKGDIVLAIKRPVISTGLKIARLRAADVPSLLVQGVVRIRCEDPVLGGWVYLMMQRPRFIAEVLAQSGQSTGPPYASLTALRATVIPLPADLMSTTSVLEAQLSLLEAAPRTVRAAATRVPALRRSILLAAFEGRLTRDLQDARSLDDIQEAIA